MFDPNAYRNKDIVGSLRQSINLQRDESEYTEQLKDSTKNIVTEGMKRFQTQMAAGQIKMDSVADLERLVKIGLLVDGSPTEITQDQTQTATIELSETDYNKLKETDEFKKLQAQMAANLNAENEEQLS